MALRQPAGRQRYGSLSAIGVGLAGAFECDLVLRDFAALVYRRSFGSRIGLGFGGRMRGLVGVDRLRDMDWSDHGGLLKDRIGKVLGSFRAEDRKMTIFGKSYRARNVMRIGCDR